MRECAAWGAALSESFGQVVLDKGWSSLHARGDVISSLVRACQVGMLNSTVSLGESTEWMPR